jgi:uncharacterized protein YqeY
MSVLGDRLQADLNAARKAQDRSGVLLLGTILSDVKNKRIELRSDPTDDDVLDVLRKGIKRRRESVEMYDKGNRKDLADKERWEVAALEKYLPAQASEADIRSAVRAAIGAGATSMGPLMGRVNPQFKGKAEGSLISRVAKEELAATTRPS